MKTLLFAAILCSAFSVIGQSNKSGSFHLDKEYTMNATGTIHLDASDAKVFITGSNRKTAHVKIDRDVTTKGISFGDREFSVDVTEQNGNLSIRERSQGGSVGIIGSYQEHYTIKLEIPEGTSLNIKGDDGDYFIKAVNGSIELDLDDADVELTGCLGNSFKIKLDDGDLRMDTGKGVLDVDGDDADVNIKNANFEKVTAHLDDGDFIVETSLADMSNYYIEVQDGLVAFKVLDGGGHFDIRHDDARVTTEGNFEIVERSEDRTQVTLSNGNAKVSIRADDARIWLTR
jgi:hypothetical protein